MASVKEIVYQVVSEQFDRSLRQLSNEMHLFDDLGADSLDIAEMQLKLERSFSDMTKNRLIEIPEAAAERFERISDVVKHMESIGMTDDHL